MLKKLYTYFSLTEKLIWLGSVTAILLSAILLGNGDWLKPFSSLIGVTSLIFCAKGNPIGQMLMVVFSVFYGIFSFFFAYYGEMITYLGMTLPMSLWGLIAWLRHPSAKGHNEVEVARVRGAERWLLAVLTAAVTVLFYFILRALGTANLLPSTLSVTTSFAAVYLTARRTPFYALAYACNDVVLIVLWALAAREDSGYLAVVICFVAFLCNDLYGFFHWRQMERRQAKERQAG